MTGTWFEGDPADASAAEFLDAVRVAAERWDLPGVTPDTTDWVDYGTLTLLVDVPDATAVKCALAQLQVGYRRDDDWGHALEGEWGCTHLLDSHRFDQDGLTVIGLDASPAQLGTWAAGWIEAQLRRPRERHEWLGLDDEVVAWCEQLADTGLRLGDGGPMWLRRRPPDRVTRLDPGEGDPSVTSAG